MGAYDGYKYAKKKKLKGVKKAAAIVGGAALGAINPFKVVKAASKAGKLVKNGVKAAKALKNGKKAGKAAKATKAMKYKVVKPDKKLANNRYNKSTNKAVKKASNGGCFVTGTKIHTKDGFKNIEAIKVGDYVWSQDPTTNEKALKSVKKIFVREKDSIIRLAINGEIIETTEEHPFYVEGKGFIAAAELKAGDEVRLFDDEEAYIDSIEEIELTEPIKVYNFEVEDFHTYYVSEQKVLVHNMCMVENGKTVAGKAEGTVTSETNLPALYYPLYDGAVPGSEKSIYLLAGDKIDRFGSLDGNYFSPKGTPMWMRALPYNADKSNYTMFEVVKPFPVESSKIAPAFCQLGGGTQYRTLYTAEKLLRLGIIKEIGE